MTMAAFDKRVEQIEAGGRLSPEEVEELWQSPDILPIGMLADTLRRRMHGTRASYLRVASLPLDGPFTADAIGAAGEVHLIGTPESLDAGLAGVGRARVVAEGRTVSAFSWHDVARLAAAAGLDAAEVLRRLKRAGLDSLAAMPLDTIDDLPGALERLRAAGFERVRLTVDEGVAGPDVWQRASELQERLRCIQALSPLPAKLRPFRPTTGYSDVKTVAAARLAAPDIPVIQVDWSRYGPKLAQVALTFGADDVWGVAASDAAPAGRRRAAVEEIRRNIEAAGFEPVERDGRFTPRA
jgi:aminodeoxyfutalosine synthase